MIDTPQDLARYLLAEYTMNKIKKRLEKNLKVSVTDYENAMAELKTAMAELRTASQLLGGRNGAV